MPPRARKTAAAVPDPDGEPKASVTVETGEATPVGDPGPEVAVPADAPKAKPRAATTKAAPAPSEPAVDEPARTDPVPVVAPTPTYHWQRADGGVGDPCRLCAPAGPPPGAGSFGCAHGQWVLAPDAV